MTTLREAAQQAIALICSARLCEVNSMSSRQEMLRLLIEATDLLRAALAQQAEPKGGGNLPPPLQAEPVQEPVAVHQFRKQYCANWYDGYPDHTDGGGPYEERTLYTAPPQRKPLSLTDLQEALVLTNLIDRDAIDDPEEYDEGSTLAQIDELYRIIIKE